MHYTIPLCDFLSGSFCSVQIDVAVTFNCKMATISSFNLIASLTQLAGVKTGTFSGEFQLDANPKQRFFDYLGSYVLLLE